MRAKVMLDQLGIVHTNPLSGHEKQVSPATFSDKLLKKTGWKLSVGSDI
jgi:hypothetical protein